MATTGSKVRKTATTTQAKQKADTDVAEVKAEQKPEKIVPIKRELDPHMYVTVKNGFNGTLVYRSKRTGERFIWREFGDEQDIELQELRSARNADKIFFVNNWFLFDDPEIIEWLGMERYYKYALDSKEFDKIFTKKPDEIEKIVSALSEGQRKTLIFRTKQMISEGKIDSIRVINALEKSLSVDLIEHHE